MKQEHPFNSDNIFRSFWKFILLNMGIVFILLLVQCPSCIFSWQEIVSRKSDIIFSFLMSSSLSFGGYYVDLFFENRISWIKEPLKRLTATLFTYMVYSFIVSFILITGIVLIFVDEVTIHNISWVKILENTIPPTIIAFTIISIFIARGWLFEWRNTALEAEKLKSENIASQYQSLKDQLNPHFLFNSLNVLSNLVYESADKSAEFIQQLSRIYRHVLDVQNEELVTLNLELDFAINFLSLQKIRFEESLEFHLDNINPKDWMIPPLSLQLLLENAIKHNIISQAKPLKIWIGMQGESLVVKNNYQPKQSKETNSGIGLNNITKRYNLLSETFPEIIQTEREFIVKLPLLKITK
ncbi:Histidine kinase [Belliella buryatensis]|uniref:Histidine kinase n=1 Tax=Belliella buryatensis TaxID=1500549 RepID=A0A239DJW3_9BACT|nr:histidine kinase [Belliella buryatensis]SNS32311.1 Histidine kinase [Belliella buryatensis]